MYLGASEMPSPSWSKSGACGVHSLPVPTVERAALEEQRNSGGLGLAYTQGQAWPGKRPGKRGWWGVGTEDRSPEQNLERS